MLIFLYFFFFVTANVMPILMFVYASCLQEGYIVSQFLLSVKCVKLAEFSACQICDVKYSMAVT